VALAHRSPSSPDDRAYRRAARATRRSPGTADLLWLLTSSDAFDLLYTDRGLSVDDTTRVLVATAERSLLR
jgi:hypothetical protein